MAQTTASKTNSGRIILAAILAIFVYGMIAAMLGTVMPTLPLDTEQKASVALAQAVGLIIASLSAGPIIDNQGKKTALLTGLGLITVALFALPNASGYGAIMGFFLLLGLGGGLIVTAGNALVSDINEERRSTTLNFLNLFFGLGGFATPFVAANLLNNDVVKLLYTGAVLTAITLIVHVTTPIPPPSGDRGFKMSEAGDLLARPALWLLSLFLFLYVACEVGVWNWLVQYLVARGIPQASATNTLAFGFAIGLLIGRVVVSGILIRVPAPVVTLGSAVLMAITTYLMLQVTTATAAGIAVFCAGVAMAPVFPTTLGMVGDAFPRATATAMGIVITFGWIGLAISSPIIGQLSGGTPEGLGSALLVIPAASVLMIVVNLALRPMLKKG